MAAISRSSRTAIGVAVAIRIGRSIEQPGRVAEPREHRGRARARGPEGRGRGHRHEPGRSPRCRRSEGDDRRWDGCHPPPSPGARDRAGGRQPRPGRPGSTGTYYGAPQLSATAQLAVIGSATPAAHALSKAPGAGTEWELVRVRGTVVDVRRYGQAWRAELRLADGTKVPIVGLARASIAVELIKEGQAGSIVGIIRRAYPSATDRRFAVLPRTRSDLDLGAAPATAGRASGSTKPTSAVGSSTGATPSPSGPSSVDGSVTVEAADVPAHAGRLVRVGGLVARPLRRGPGADVAVLIEDDSGTRDAPLLRRRRDRRRLASSG